MPQPGNLAKDYCACNCATKSKASTAMTWVGKSLDGDKHSEDRLDTMDLDLVMETTLVFRSPRPILNLMA